MLRGNIILLLVISYLSQVTIMEIGTRYTTPRKLSKSCCVCDDITGENRRKVRSNNKATKKISDLLELYGGIRIVDGFMCRPCYHKLLKIDRDVAGFRELCQSSKIGLKRCIEPLTDLTNTTCSISQIQFSPIPFIQLSCEKSGTFPKILKSKPNLTKRSLLSDSGFQTQDNSSCHIDDSTHTDVNLSLNEDESIITCGGSDHTYAKSRCQKISKVPKTSTPLKKACSTSELDNVEEPMLAQTEKSHLLQLINAGGYVSHIGDMLLKNSNFYNYIESHFKAHYTEKMKTMNNERHGFISVLMKKKFQDVSTFSWERVCNEFQTQFPLIANIIEGIMLKEGEKNRKSILPKLGMVYAICAQSRHPKLSLVQRMLTLCLLDNIADQKGKIDDISTCEHQT